MKKLYFVRHGETEMIVKSLWAGSRTETPLTDEGRRQAKEAGKLAKDLHIDLIVSSPMTRTRETAEIIAREIGYPVESILENELFIEQDFGELEAKPYKPNMDFEGIPEVETKEALIERARKALAWLESQEAGNILLVSHGSFGRALRSHVKKDFPYSHPHRLANAEIYEWL